MDDRSIHTWTSTTHPEKCHSVQFRPEVCVQIVQIVQIVAIGIGVIPSASDHQLRLLDRTSCNRAIHGIQLLDPEADRFAGRDCAPKLSVVTVRHVEILVTPRCRT
jgi:hypothetical protein